MVGFAHVAIDGPAGSGKTTVAQALARRLGILYLDTGAMYRAVALMTLRAGADPNDETRVRAIVDEHPVRATVDAEATHGFRIWAGDEPLGDELKANDVSRVVSLIAAHPAVRAAMVERQRAIATEGRVVMAGRDIGTVVLPDAPLKIFLTASLDERVERRLAELAEVGRPVERGELKRQLAERDRLDATRPVAPLRRAAGAVEIDSTGETVEAVVDRIAALRFSAGRTPAMIPAVYAACKFGSWAFFRISRGYRVVGAEHVPPAGPVIIACNHLSYFDPPALGVAVPRPVAYMAKIELFRVPVLGPLIRALGAFPVDRSRGDVAAMRAAVRVLQAGAVFGIFPEGGRNVDGTKKPQMGVALLASWSGASVIPAYVSGTAQRKRSAPIVVRFGEPLRFEPGQKARRDDLAKWTEELMDRIYALREK